MANTNILIKRSVTTGRPVSLQAGEFAYSYSSNTLYLGSPAGTGVVNVGGQYYTSTLDAATAANTASTLVKRDANGMFAGRLTGIADKADQLTNARNFSISGTDITASTQSFDGSAAIVLNAALNAVPGLSAGTYGSTTQIPSVTVAANGRVIAISTNNVATDLEVVGDSGNTTIDLLTETLSLTGGAGITSTVTNNQVTFDVDTSVVRANTPISLQTIDSSLTINGSLTVLGTQTTINTQTLNVADPMIYLAANNTTSDAVDIGFAGTYNDGSQRATGVFRNAGNKEFYVFDNYDKALNSNNEIDVADASFRAANVNANYVKSTGLITSNVESSSTQDLKIGPLGKQTTIVSSTGIIQPYGAIQGGNYGGNQIDVNSIGFGTQIKGVYEGVDIRVSSDGSGSNVSSFNTNGTLTVAGKVTAAGINLNDYTQAAFNKANSAVVNPGSSLTIGSIVIGAGGNNITTLANTTYSLTGSLSAAKTITSLSVDAYGRVTAATGADISIDTSQISSGTLGYGRGGTGSTSYTTGALLVAGDSGLVSIANTTFVATNSTTVDGGINRLGGVGKTITSVSVDAYGRFKALTYDDISGLQLYQGGTGVSSFTTNGVTYGNGTSAMGVTAAAGTSDQTWSNQILTTTNAGVPVWTSALDGGQF